MAYLSTKLKKLRKHIIPVIIITFLMLLTGCDPYAGKYPDSEASTWECVDPPMTMNYLEDDGIWATVDQNCVLFWEGQEIPVEFYYQSCTFECRKQGTNDQKGQLFIGTWEYPWENLIQNKDKVVFHIDRDEFFDGQYEALVFERVE